MEIYLATTSAARISLFGQLGLPFKSVAPEGVQEATEISTTPEDLVVLNATMKAKSVAETLDEGLVIGCDTLGFLEGVPLGKPNNAAHAREMLLEMNGKTHLIETGIAVVDCATGAIETDFDKTLVTFKRVPEKVIEEYAKSGEPLGKAGAYAFQGRGGALLIAKAEGSASNVIGIPLQKLLALLAKFGVAVGETK